MNASRYTIWRSFGHAAASVLLCVMGTFAHWCWAAEPATPAGAPQAIQFRRIYAPANRVQDWPTGKTPYVPVDAKEVERLLETAEASVSGAPAADAPQVETARYDARLDGDELLVGHATLDIQHKSKATAVLPLSPCSVAIENPSWADHDQSKAIVGNGVDGRLGAIVNASGKLQFDWSLRGERNSGGTVSFRWEMAACPASRLTLDLPQRMLVFVNHGLVSAVPGAPEGQRRWNIDFGGYSRVVLRIATEEAAREQRQLALLRQSLTYEFSPRGLDVVAQLKIDVHNEPLQRVTVDLGPDLRLVSARIADRDIPWSANLTQDKHSRVVLELPEPLLGAGGVLRLTALAPLVSGQSWRLPSVRAEGLFWQEGTATLLVPAPLALEQLATQGCRQSKTAPLPNPQTGDSIELQYFSPDANIDVEVGRPQGRIKVESGAQLEIGQSEIVAVVVAELSLKEGERYLLQATLPNNWQVDSVECSRPEAIADWQIDSLDKLSQQLVIRLGKSLSPRNPMRLILRGHRAFSPSDLLDARDLQLLQFRDAMTTRQLLALRGTDGFEITTSGGEQLTRLDALRLSATDSRLFATAPSGMLMAIDAGFAPLKVSIESRKPSFTADILADVAVTGDSLAESTVLRIVPQAARLEKLLVHFSQPSPIRWQWTSVGANPGQLSATRWTSAEQTAAGFSTAGETWEINLRAPTSESFELKAVRTRTFNGRQGVALATVADASAQQGAVTIRALGDTGLLIKNRRLKAVQSQPTSTENYQTTRGAFRFEPSRDAMETDPILTITPAPAAQSESGAFAWHFTLESHLALRGMANHVVTYRLQTAGRQQVRIVMPPESELRSAWVDNVPVAQAAMGAIDEGLLLDLPAQRRFASIRLNFTTAGSLPRLTTSIAPPLPQIDVPVMDGNWRVFVPAGYEVSGADSLWPTRPRANLTWSVRLFGPLGRSAEERFFQPLSRDSWLGLTAQSRTAEAVDALDESATARKTATAFPWNDTPTSIETQVDASRHVGLSLDVYEVSLSAGTNPSLRILHTWAMHLLGWGIFLLLVGVVAWVGAGHLRRCLIATGLLGVLAIVAPTAYVPLITPAFLAMFGCLLCFAVGPRLFASVAVHRAADRSWRLARSIPATTLLICGGLLAGSDLAGAADQASDPEVAIAQTIPAKPANATETTLPTSIAGDAVTAPPVTAKVEAVAEPEIYKIFIPVDNDRKPTGGKYFVPESLYNELLRRAASATEQPGAWVLQNASYHGTLTREGAQKKLLVSELKAAFDFQAFQANVTVRVPLVHDGLVLPADGSKLDGQPVKTQWEAGGRWLEVQISEPGTYRLELALRPSVQSFGTATGFDIGIPPLPNSTLELQLPIDTSAVELPGQRGRLSWDKQRGLLTAALGPTGRLSVRLPEAAAQQGAAPNLDVDELLWIKVRPGSTTVDARFRFRVLEGRVRQLRLVADPRLRLLPSNSGDSPIAGIHNSSGTPNAIDIELSRTVSDQVSVDLTFLLTGVSGVGNLRLPRLEAVGARPAKRWLAVSVDPALQTSLKDGQDLMPISVPEFSAAWGAADNTPQEAYAVERGEPNWVLSTQSAEAQNSVEQSLSLSFGQQQARVKYDATLSTAVSYNFQIRLQAPPNLQIENLAIFEDGVQRVARWQQDPTGLVTAFLSTAATGRQQISLVGQLPYEPGANLELPKVYVLGAKLTRNQVQVFRQPTTLLEIEDSPGVTIEQAPSLDKSKLELGSFVGSYLLDGPQAAIEFKLAPNLPETSMLQVTSIQNDNDLWTADVDCQLQVRGGLVDLLRLSIPAQWTGPFQLSQPASVEVVSIPGESRRQLVIRPAAPIEDKYRISIRSPLSVSVGDRMRVPDVLPLGMSHLQRFVVLPTQLELQRIVWSLSNLRPATLPQTGEVHAKPSAAASLAAFQVQGERFDAVLKSVERSSGDARVRLADVNVGWSIDGHFRGVVSFDIEPAGSTECLLHCPAGLQLLHVTVADMPAHLLEVGDNRWRISLSSPQLPQRLSAVFSGVIAASGWESGQCHFDVPSLVGLEADKTIWSIYGPPQAGVGQPGQTRAVAGNLFHELGRYRSLVNTLDLPADIAAEHSSEELQRWYRVWRARCVASRAALQAELQLAARRGSPSEAEAECLSIDEEFKRIVARLNISAPAETTGGAVDLDSPAKLLAASQLSQEPTYCALRGSSNSLTIHYPALGGSDTLARLGWLCGLGIATALGLVVIDGKQTSTPRLAPIALAGGIFWWLLLTPSVLGLAITVASGLMLFRQHWRHRTGRN